MKKFLQTSFLAAFATVMLPGSAIAALPVAEQTPADLKPLWQENPAMEAAEAPQAYAAPEGGINYGSYMLFCGYQYNPTSAEGTHLEFKDVCVHTGDNLFLQSWQDYAAFYGTPGTKVTDDNLSCELLFYSFSDPWDAAYVVSEVQGWFDISIDFDGEKAQMTLTKTRDLTYTPANAAIVTYQGTSLYPQSVDGNKVTYSDMLLSGEELNFLLVDRITGLRFGWNEEQTPIGPSNLSTTLIPDPGYYADIIGLEGNYDVVVEYNEDITSATVTFSKHEVADAIANYSGDLYLRGVISGWEMENPEYKMTCIEPGIFEWSGKEITGSFLLVRGNDTSIPGTDINLTIGSNNYPTIQYITGSNNPINLKLGDDYLNIVSGGTIINPHITVNLKDMTMNVEGTLTHYNVALNQLYLVPGDGLPLWGEVAGDEIVFSNIEMDEIKEFIFREYLGLIFGWTNDDNQTPVSADNTTTTAYWIPLPSATESGFIKTDLKGTYDIYASFNEDQTELRVEFVNIDIDGVESTFASDNISLSRNADGVSIHGVESGAQIKIYTIEGVNVYNAVADGGRVDVRLAKGATYIVVAGGKPLKVQM